MPLLQHLRVKYPGIFPERLKSVFLKIRERDAGARANTTPTWISNRLNTLKLRLNKALVTHGSNVEQQQQKSNHRFD